MDSLTHIAIGACIGESFFEKGFGKKAMWWGALAQSIPDIDFVSSLWLSSSEALLAHRGFTHSFLFLLMIVPIMAFIAYYIHKPRNISIHKWILFFFVEVFIHLFIDAFNNYGIGWLEPFSHERFSFNVIYVADPFFSFPVGLAFASLIFLNRHHIKRRMWWKIGIYFPLFYLFYCSINKVVMYNKIQSVFKHQNMVHTNYFFTPAPLQNWLWFVVAGDSSGYNIGYCSVFDKSENVQFRFVKQNSFLLNLVSDHENLQRLIRFSKGYYTVSNMNDTLIFNDLRFGQINGWVNPENKFVFHYYLNHLDNERLMIQKGRFSAMSMSGINSLFQRALIPHSFLLK